MIRTCARKLVCALALMLAGAIPMAHAAIARTLEVGPSKLYTMPSLAAADARDGDRIVIEPGEYFDCAVWRANGLTIEGADPDATAVITDKTCLDKALF